ncbi:hypothetical protein EI94DRAFT_1743908 [Lactarius quietus]|nr:hypothetical protein EI94DRAFT_1743908 [Lactarius quietus]
MAPCHVAQYRQVCNLQKEPNQRIANDRPRLDADHLPTALLYHGFGRFLDASSGASTYHNLDINPREFESRVDKFMASMDAYYDFEVDRKAIAVKRLNDIFECCLGKNTPPLAAEMVVDGEFSDGRVLGPANTIEVILQVENELGSSDTDPIIECCANYTQAVISRFSFPALGIIVVGSHIAFYALAYLYQERTRLVALTPLLLTTTESGNNWAKPALLDAFKAACILRYHIHEDTKKFLASQKELLPSQRNLPYVNEVAAYPPGASTLTNTICFHICDEAYQGKTRYPNRFLYIATLNNTEKEVVIVKFTRQYFPEFHAFCAEQGHAPQLLGYGMIPGGWRVVVMEKS